MKEYDIAQMTDDEFDAFINSTNAHKSDDEVIAFAAGWKVDAQQRREQAAREDVEDRR